MIGSKFSAKLLKNIASSLLFFYALLLCVQTYLYEGELSPFFYALNLFNALLFTILSISVYKRFGFAEILAMLFSTTYVFAVVLGFFGVEAFAGAPETSLREIFWQILDIFIHSGILLTLFRLRYLRSRKMTENFQTQKYPDFKKF